MPKISFMLRLKLGREGLLGPGKADLLAHVDSTGSISAAARSMRMSYKRAWLLLDEMNRHFGQPVVTTSFGGSKGGGAQLTPFGRQLLERYRHMLAAVHKTMEDDIAWLDRHTGHREAKR